MGSPVCWSGSMVCGSGEEASTCYCCNDVSLPGMGSLDLPFPSLSQKAHNTTTFAEAKNSSKCTLAMGSGGMGSPVCWSGSMVCGSGEEASTCYCCNDVSLPGMGSLDLPFPSLSQKAHNTT